MKVDILLGLQWGDEGKGKLVDALSPDYDVIARFQGGPNAGHSLEFNNIKHVLHLIPSGIFHSDKLNIIGNGVVIDPAVFKKEIDELKPYAADLTSRLVISSRANLILPTHRILDAAYEQQKGFTRIGSTLKGIGPAYTDKTGRNGLRVGDILNKDFKTLYMSHVERHLSLLRNFSYEFDLKEFEKGWFEGIDLLKEFRILNTEYLVNELCGSGKKVLAEGAQGTMLDVDFGSYPFVTSSNTISAGACTGLGISPRIIGEVFGIFKAYCTRVGSGPFPTELNDETGDALRNTGKEFGSTTGRPRRCGWLDLPALKYSIMINGTTQLFMTKADVMSGFKTIKVCTSYRIEGKEIKELPFGNDLHIEPVYTEMAGWNQDISAMHDYNKLPVELTGFIEFIEKYCGVPVTLVSVGPDREETIFRKQ
ncbi:MAG: adenylosuccinate synthase [Bacteroidetes bacterium GWE2_41_25]|nr:MAG: adenylosuccinate synthase [Bacteroidetes bacterium GWA2_40_15]OFX94832.1 MAG: adenylosuccinate synthase [Bacteroidetes bacterium GWC2_40_22]OFY00486.1 MAG: adenylosuccinate synthase [Bacteroidetes bacterium GWE2_41_25]OFY57554.1 MAG: adenylosuccinate synthase [Bacteroidetes bacterium GWF2_41_9]HAM10468.1 adenylosuccinate synthase [Bacteroidales bacterium]